MKNDIGVIGLGVMGASLARNMARNGLRVAAHNRSLAKARALAAAHPDAGLDIAEDLRAFVASLERPRRIVLLIAAGQPVDDMLDVLDLLLEPDDIVVDAGNSMYTDTDRRGARARGRPWRFVGMGVSGGEEGALLGPSMMPGGDLEAWGRLRDVLEKIAAKGSGGPCVTHCGRGSAGHFVKMVHNGIEYGDMQLIAESAALLREGCGLAPNELADVFSAWNEGELESYLIEITADIFRVADPDHPGRLLLDAVEDRAGQKGTGLWTVVAAAELGVAIPTIAAAVHARIVSSKKELRQQVEPVLGGQRGRIAGVSTNDVRDALYAAKIASYAQGFELLARASEAKDYGTDLAEIARIWTAGCIIRARFLDQVAAAHRAGPVPSLVLVPHFAAELRRRLPAWRRVVATAIQAGIAVPGLAASLTWLDGIATARGSAALLQAQRDYFGAHGYERTGEPGVAQHTPWQRLARG